MILPKPIRKILAIFRGSVSPVLIFISILLGFWFGLIPGWTGFHVVIIILMLILNVHTGLFLLSAGLGKSLCFAAAPLLYHIGIVVQNNLAGMLNFLATVPIIGITDFSRYAVAGGLVVGPVIGCVAGLLMARSVISFRRMLLKFEEGSEKFKKWYSNRWVRILDRILVGKRTKDAKALFSAKSKVIRKAGVVLAVVVLAVSAAAVILTKNNVAKDYAADVMTQANGAEVNLESLDLSLLTGAVSASKIQVTDANKPQNNQVAIGTIASDTSLYDLFLGRLVMENVEVSNVRFDQKRSAPGKVVETEGEKEPSVFDPCDYETGTSEISKLESYFKDAKALKEKLKKARKWLPKAKEKTGAQPQEEPQKYLDYLDARASVPATPRIMAKRIVFDDVQIPSDIFGNSQILLANLSDSAQTAKLPITLDIKSKENASLNLTIDYSSGDKEPEVSGTFGGFDLSKLQSSLSSDSGMTFERGLASGKFTGLLTDELIDMAVNVSIQDMVAKSQGDGVLGLGADTTSKALDVLKNLNTTLRIVGPITDPRLVFDADGLTKTFKDALINAGKQKLTEELDKQIDKQLDGQVPDELKDTLKDSKGLLDGLGGILQKKDDK